MADGGAVHSRRERGSMHLLIVGQLQHDYMALHPKKTLKLHIPICENMKSLTAPL
jgi:hypothetical protein